jgi:hypothetical protein
MAKAEPYETPLTVLSWEYHVNPDGPVEPGVEEWGFLAVRLRNPSPRPLWTTGQIRYWLHFWYMDEPYLANEPRWIEAQCRFPAAPLGCEPVRIEPFGEVDVEWYTWNYIELVEISAFGIPPIY